MSRAPSLQNTRTEAKKRHDVVVQSIVSQNLRGLKSDERLEELFAGIKDRNILAACLQETWRSGVGCLENGQCRLFHAGLDEDQQCRRGSQGVAIVLGPQGVDAWRAAGSVVHSDLGARVIAARMIVQDIHKRDVGLFLISAYAPVGVADADEWTEFFASLNRCIARKRNDDVLLIGSDTNSSMGCLKSDADFAIGQQSPLGRFGLKHENNSGLRFSSYLAINNYLALTTYFRKKQYGTWIHPRSKLPHQIDHFITEHKEFCRFTDAGVTIPLLDSDHQAIQCKLRVMVRLKKRTPPRTHLLRIDYKSLHEEDTRNTFCQKLLQAHIAQPAGSSYTRLAASANIAALETLPKKQRAQPGWFAAAEHRIAPLIENRNIAMAAVFKRSTRLNTNRLREARRVLKTAVSSAKNDWIALQCNEMNAVVAGHRGTKACWDTLSVLRRGLSKTRPSAERTMKKPDGSLCSSPEENAGVFRNHFEKLYGRTAAFDPSVLDLLETMPAVPNCDHTPTSEEIMAACHKLKDKSPGESGLTPQMWKALTTNQETFALLENVIVEFWESELTPSEWEKGLLTILAKKGDLSLPDNYRGIMLLEAVYKIVSIILHGRLLPIEERLDHETQCGFRPGRGCSDGVFTLKLALKKRREHGLESWVLFIDLVKAFDRVPRELLWKVLEKFGVPPKLLRLLKSLHAHVEVSFVVNEITQTIECVIGVKQGDILGPILFTFYLATIMIT